ncbi:MAG TPA: sulfatase-like hydrolase/transferase [Polyangiaceae bacterium]|nr:sulfatase-like hydrolase/transferase [Polyangiaceae bacterium]
MKQQSLFVSKPLPKLRNTTREHVSERDAEARRSHLRIFRTPVESQRANRLRARVAVDRGSPMNNVQEHASRKVPRGAPNVLCVVLDDVGFGWIDAFGGLVETPALSRLAASGLRYVNHHAPSSPAEARACLLTGRNSPASSVQGELEPSEGPDIAGVLHEHGYATLCLDDEPKVRGRSRAQRAGSTEDLVDRAATFVWHRRSEDPERPWFCCLHFAARREPHRIGWEWTRRYTGAFDGGWDAYRRVVLDRQKKMGVVAPHTELAPMPEGSRAWESLCADEKRRFARVAELHAGCLSHADAQLGRLLGFLDATGQLDDTLVLLLLGPAGGDAVRAVDQFGRSAAYGSLPLEWAFASNTPFKLYEQGGRLGGTRSPLIVHWPQGLRSKGELRTQFHHVVDLAPTILSAIGIEPPPPRERRQGSMHGVALNYSFDDAGAPTKHVRQHFEVLGNRAIVSGKWKAVAHRPRTERPSRERIRFDEDRWELYDLERDPSECHDLLAANDVVDVAHPTAQKLFELVELWWAEARRYAVLPLDGSLDPLVPARRFAARERSPVLLQ